MVRLGEHDRTVIEGYEESIKVKEIYTSAKQHVTLLKLKRKAVLHKRVLPICLPEDDANVIVNSSCYVTSWQFANKDGNFTDVLNKAQVEIAPFQDCNASYSGKLSEYEVCANFTRGKTRGCNVERGAPLVCPRIDGRFVLTGVASAEDGCSNAEQYGVFLDVKMMLPFINDAISMIQYPYSV